MKEFKNVKQLEQEVLNKYVIHKTNLDLDADFVINNNTLSFARDFFDYSLDSKEFLGLVEILKNETFEYQVNVLGYEPSNVSFNKEDLIKDMKDFHNKYFLIQDIVVDINNKIDSTKISLNEYNITIEKIKKLALKYIDISIIEGVLENISAKEYKEIENQIKNNKEQIKEFDTNFRFEEVDKYLLKNVLEKEELEKVSFETKKAIEELFLYLDNNVENKIMLNRYKTKELEMVLFQNKEKLFQDDFDVAIKSILEEFKKEIIKKENEKELFFSYFELEQDILNKYVLYYGIDLDVSYQYKASKNSEYLDFFRDFFDHMLESSQFKFLVNILKEKAYSDNIDQIDEFLTEKEFEEEIYKIMKDYDKKREKLSNIYKEIEIILKRYTDDTLLDLDISEYDMTKEKIKELAIKYEDFDFLDIIKEYLDSSDYNNVYNNINKIITQRKGEQNKKKEIEEKPVVANSNGVKLESFSSLLTTNDRVLSSIVSNEVIKDNTIMNDKTKKYNVDNFYVDSDILKDKDRKKTIFETLVSNEVFMKSLKIEDQKDAKKILQTYLDNNIIVVLPNKLNNEIYNFFSVDKASLENVKSINNPYVTALVFSVYRDNSYRLLGSDVVPYYRVDLEQNFQIKELKKLIESSKCQVEDLEEINFQQNEEKENRNISDSEITKLAEIYLKELFGDNFNMDDVSFITKKAIVDGINYIEETFVSDLIEEFKEELKKEIIKNKGLLFQDDGRYADINYVIQNLEAKLNGAGDDYAYVPKVKSNICKIPQKK